MKRAVVAWAVATARRSRLLARACLAMLLAAGGAAAQTLALALDDGLDPDWPPTRMRAVRAASR